MPDLLTDGDVGLLKADFVQEATLEGGVQVLRKVGGSDEDAVQILHLL